MLPSLFLFVWILIPAESLKCIQCESQTSDARPLCNLQYWGQVNMTQRKNMVMHCPTSRSAFCITVIEYLSGDNERVRRGCTVDHTQNGLGLVRGCFRSLVKTACLCDTDLCNVSSTLFPKIIAVGISLASLFVVILK